MFQFLEQNPHNSNFEEMIVKMPLDYPGSLKKVGIRLIDLDLKAKLPESLVSTAGCIQLASFLLI